MPISDRLVLLIVTVNLLGLGSRLIDCQSRKMTVVARGSVAQIG